MLDRGGTTRPTVIREAGADDPMSADTFSSYRGFFRTSPVSQDRLKRHKSIFTAEKKQRTDKDIFSLEKSELYQPL